MTTRCCKTIHSDWRYLLPFLVLSLSSLLPSLSVAQPSPIRTEIFNKTGTLLASSPFQYIPVFDAGWTRASLCGSSLSDCSLEFYLEQLSPSPVDGCGISAEFQVDCQAQTSPLNFAQMVCVSTNTQGELLFPQDSPTISWVSTVSMGLGNTGSIGINFPVVVSNPAVAYISPSRVDEFEAIAIRNTQPSSEYLDSSRSPSSSSSSSSIRDGSTLPTRIVLLNPQGAQSACADVNYFISVRVVHNALCASYVYFPNSTHIIPGTNTTNSSTVIIPARNITTTVDCLGSHSTCAVAYNDDKRINYTSVCMCDGGYSGSINRGRDDISDACGVEKSLDISIPMSEARPPAVVYNGSDPSINWIGVNTQSTKGRMLTMLGYYLNSSSSPQTYFNLKLNLSRTVQDLSLLLHLTVHPPPSVRNLADFSLLPIQLQFSPRAYPTLERNIPLSCLNGSDLIGAASDISELTYSSSCSSLYQGFPDHITPFASPNSFKLLFQPAFVQGFLNQSNIADNDMDTQITLYFSLYFQQGLSIDIRTWYEENLQMYVPRMLSSSEKKKREQGNPATVSLAEDTPIIPSAPASPSASTSIVSPVASMLAYQNQSWVQHLLENEMIFFHFNDTGTGREDASLVMQINDTSCVSGGATLGFYAPHWWYSANGASALAAGMSETGLNDMATPPVEGLPSFMALSGGCFRPNQRYTGSAAQNAGIFGQLYTVCETVVELAVWHVLPLELSTAYMNTFYFVELNATGSNCWREFTLDIATSVQNDLLVTVDQPDAHILMRLGNYPTLDLQYNRTTQQSIPANDDLGGSSWQQHRIAYSDLSHGTYWNLAVYLDPSPGDTVPHPPRAFRIQLSWQTDSSFNHLSTTMIILLSCGSGVVLLLIILAVKLRIDACRNKQRGSAASRKSQQSRKEQEKIRLTGQKQQDSYSRL